MHNLHVFGGRVADLGEFAAVRNDRNFAGVRRARVFVLEAFLQVFDSIGVESGRVSDVNAGPGRVLEEGVGGLQYLTVQPQGLPGVSPERFPAKPVLRVAHEVQHIGVVVPLRPLMQCDLISLIPLLINEHLVDRSSRNRIQGFRRAVVPPANDDVGVPV